MKILAIGDPHGKLPKNLSSLVKKNKIDVIVCIGDIGPVKRHKDGTGYVDLKKSKEIAKRLSSLKTPVIILKGNMFRGKEGARFFNNLIKNRKNMHYKEVGKLKIKDKQFILFDMVWEKWAYSHLPASNLKILARGNDKREIKLNKLLKESKDPIVVSHAPPYGYVDKIKSGKHVGSKILLKAIKKHQPPLVLCGHIHEAKGKAKIGKTKVYNLGWHGDCEIIEVEK